MPVEDMERCALKKMNGGRDKRYEKADGKSLGANGPGMGIKGLLSCAWAARDSPMANEMPAVN